MSLNGEILAKAGDERDEIIYADIDIALVNNLRNQSAFYRDRRPDLYGRIVQ